MSDNDITQPIPVDVRRKQNVEQAGRITRAGLIRRRNEQSINVNALITVIIGFVLLPAWWLSAIQSRIDRTEQRKIESMTRMASYRFNATPTVTNTNTVNTLTLTSVPMSTVTATATATQTPTLTPTATPMTRYGLYSYYYPPYGGVNCHSGNWTGTTCADATASGAHWSEYLGRGVAVPPIAPNERTPAIPYFAAIIVTAPLDIAGEYIVIDLCTACYTGTEVFYLDFLDTTQRLAWSSVVTYYVVGNAVVSPP